MVWYTKSENQINDNICADSRIRRFLGETGCDETIDIIVKYRGCIEKVANQLNVKYEIMHGGYAILGMPREKISELKKYDEIECYEFSKEVNFLTAFTSSCIRQVQRPGGLNLSGEGVIVGIIDSGVDYTLDNFKNDDGTSRILYFWDQENAEKGFAPQGFDYGREYNTENFNLALKADDPFSVIPQLDSNGHGTAVASIAAGSGEMPGVAPKSSIIVVKLAESVQPGITLDTQIMRAVKYIVDKAAQLSMPVAINISFGTNSGAHSGESLFETYIDHMAEVGNTVIVAAAGNEGSTSHHYQDTLTPNTTKRIDLFVSGTWFFYLSIWKSFADDISVQIVLPDERNTGIVRSVDGRREFKIDNAVISIQYIQPTILSDDSGIYITAYSENGNLPDGVWHLDIITTKVTDGKYDIWLPVTESAGRITRFTNPNPDVTITIPATASSVISVSAYDTETNTIAFFSGRGYTRKNVYVKPDITAPGVGVIAAKRGGGLDSYTGTSFAAPFVTGSAALMMQWGIVQGNDKSLYAQRVKAFLIAGAQRPLGESIPNNSWGYGTLCLDNTFDILINYRGSAKQKNLDRFTVFNNIKDNETTADAMDDSAEEALPVQNTATGTGPPDYSSMPVRDFIQLPGIVDFLTYDRDLIRVLLRDRTDIKVGINFLGNILLIYTFADSLPEILAFLGRNAIETYPGLFTLLDKSANDDTGITQIQNQPFISLRGSGTLVGFVDTGIDYTKSVFKYEDGSSKIRYIWDQTAPSDDERVLFGRVYTRDDITAALRSDDPYSLVPERDEIGHGTFLASVAAGRDEGDYIGAAPDAEIIMVKVREARQFYKEELNRIDVNGPLYQSTDIMAGIKFVADRTVELLKPIAICIALGTNMGPHNGSSIIENYIALLSRFVGAVFITAAGNESNANRHAQGKIDVTGQSKTVSVKVETTGTNFNVNIWFNGFDRMSVSFRSPTGEFIDREIFENSKVTKHKLVFEDTTVKVSYNQDGMNLIFISVTNSVSGIWDIILQGDRIINGEYNAWLPLTYPGAKVVEFVESSPNSTIVVPATSLGSITCGAYNSANGGLYISSSWGPTLFPQLCPDFVAPGVDIIGISPTGETTMTGTSVAAALTTGASALLLEWGLIKGNNISMDSSDIRTMLISGCEQTAGNIYPNNRFGYGLINIYNTFNNLRET